ncbi:MAG: hypothetical protein HOP29_18375 [Phycisphaerales bacterium]|nr:hypothetical protein [Phycisphaerales bacterium]
MDMNWVTIVVGVAIVVAVGLVIVFFRKHSNVKGSMTGPGGMGMSFEAGGRQQKPVPHVPPEQCPCVWQSWSYVARRCTLRS